MDIETLVTQHELGSQVFTANLDGLTHDDSLFQPQGGGNCLNWIIGHLVKARNTTQLACWVRTLYTRQTSLLAMETVSRRSPTLARRFRSKNCRRTSLLFRSHWPRR